MATRTITLTSEPTPDPAVPPPVNLHMRAQGRNRILFSYDEPPDPPGGATYHFAILEPDGRTYWSGQGTMVHGTASGSFRIWQPGIYTLRTVTKVPYGDHTLESQYVSTTLRMPPE